MSSLGSALAIAMMLGGGGTPPFAVLFGTYWIRIQPRKPSSHAARLLLSALLLNMYAHGKGQCTHLSQHSRFVPIKQHKVERGEWATL